MIFGFFAILGCLIWLDRYFSRRERELKRLENDLWHLDARERRLESEGWMPIEDYGLPDAGSTTDLLMAEDGRKVHEVRCMRSGCNSWDWLAKANYFTHWRYNEEHP